MQLDFGENTKFHVRISLHIDDFVGNFPTNLGEKDTVVTPAANILFEVGKIKFLGSKMQEKFNTCVEKGTFIGTCSCLGI